MGISRKELKKNELLRVVTATDASRIVAEMDDLLLSRGEESPALQTADDIFHRMSAYMGAPVA